MIAAQSRGPTDGDIFYGQKGADNILGEVAEFTKCRRKRGRNRFLSHRHLTRRTR
jgi:hypothetical protein